MAESQIMHHGNVFETLVLGKGIHGAVEANETLKKSAYWPTLQEQAKTCRMFLKEWGGRLTGVQVKIQTSFKDGEDTIYIEGTLDATYEFADGREAVLDLKHSEDNEATFGKFQWGDETSIDVGQAKHYPLLVKLKRGYGDYPEFRYMVFSKKAGTLPKVFDVEIKEPTKLLHMEGLAEAYKQIMVCITTGVWPVKNTYANCSRCKTPCDQQKKTPDIIKIIR